jgi:MFS family permease
MKMLQFFMKKFFNELFKIEINYIIKALIVSYTIILAGWGMISPIIAVYITEKIGGAGIETVGFAITFYALTKSILQIPLGRVLDATRGEYDEWIVLMIGYLLLATTAFAYAFVNTVIFLFVVQILYGIADAFIYTAWNSLFTKHLDQNNIATENSIYATSADITVALSASLGALLIAYIGYSNVFFIVATFSFIAALTILPIRVYVKNLRY